MRDKKKKRKWTQEKRTKDKRVKKKEERKIKRKIKRKYHWKTEREKGWELSEREIDKKKKKPRKQRTSFNFICTNWIKWLVYVWVMNYPVKKEKTWFLYHVLYVLFSTLILKFSLCSYWYNDNYKCLEKKWTNMYILNNMLLSMKRIIFLKLIILKLWWL